MLVTMKEILNKAKKQGYGVAAPNVWDENSIKTALQAAEEEKAPIILDFAEPMGDIFEFGKIAKALAENSSVPVAINLDHGGSFEIALKAIRAGFTSIMVDRSTLSFKENIEQVREITKIAHSIGISVEAELGHVGQGLKYDDDRNAGLTNVEEAETYIKETGIDCLAIAIGTAHGAYKGTPYLDYKRLKDIKQHVNIPLVLHGGSGTGDEALKKAVENGINKVNLFTDLSTAGCNSIKEYISKDNNISLLTVIQAAYDGYKAELEHYIKLFNSSNKA